jgi:hypothetical protein
VDRSKGIAYCGLACAVCSENASCVGCRDDGCAGKEWCKNLKCCRTRGIDGCWDCKDFPCSGTMLDKLRVRAFASFVKQHGGDLLLDCLERNERAGIKYHYPGMITGDYDIPESEAGILDLLMLGKQQH